MVLPGEGPLQEVLVEEGFEVRIHNLGILRRKYISPKGMANRLEMTLKAYHFFNQLHREIHFELVYSNTLAVIIGAIWAKRNGVKHIWHIHEIIHSPKPLVRMLSHLLDWTTPFPIVVSESVKNHWAKKLKKAKPQVIYNGICYNDFGAKKNHGREKGECLVITMVGRINPGKGQLFFLSLAGELLKKYAHLKFFMVGDPYPGYEDIREKIHQKINSQGLEGNVMDLGFRKDIPQIMGESDIFVLPSTLPDSFPTVILEAMASRLPVLATRSGGAEEMVEAGKTGELINIGDVAAGVAVLSSWIENPQWRQEMGINARKRVLKEFSLESFKAKLKEYLWEIIPKN